MTERIRQLKQFFIHEKAHHAYRQPALDRYAMARRFEADRMPALQRSVERLIAVLDSEQPVVFAQERIAFMRTVPVLPELFTPEEIAEMKKTHWLHEQGEVCNINVDYALLMNVGLDAKRAELYAVVDAGATVEDIVVTHPVYGEFRAMLMLSSRRQVDAFVENAAWQDAAPLSALLTDGAHLHTLTAPDERTLDAACDALRRGGFLTA